ncbi:MAG: hypothetical protein RBR95_13135 [Ignavibacteriaceae bacterium]|jgi:hypothetical protein|nr:hypothetical protein [Ignavibacteriaceae bacterium]
MSESPYKIVNEWLFDNNLKSELDINIYNSINLTFILNSFSKCFKISLFLNKVFNNIKYIYKIDKYEFLLFLKKLIIKHRISKYDLMYYKIQRVNKEVKSVLSKFPHLKDYESEHLLEVSKNDPDYEDLLMYVGIKSELKSKSKKVPATLKKELKKETKVKKFSTNKGKVSFTKWKNNFSKT